MDEQKYCKYCGAANSTSAAFCAKCGKTFTSAPTSPPAPPPSTSKGSAGYQTLYEPPPKPRRRFKKRYVLYGIVVLLALVIVAAAFSGSTQSTTDYSSYYNSYFSGTSVSVTPFYKTTSATGNDLYIGVVRNLSSPQSMPNTITFEFATSQAQAAQLYQSTVANATQNGFVTNQTDNGASLYPATPVAAWQGDSSLAYRGCGYYQDPSVGNAWVVETQYVAA